MLHSTRKALEENEKAVSEDEKKSYYDAAADLETLLKDENATKNKLKRKLKVLTEKSHKLAEAMYKKRVEKLYWSKQKHDDVIDAEVE